MADTKTDTKANRPEGEKQGRQGLARRHEAGLSRWEPAFGAFGSPFDFMDRISEELDRWFDRMARGGFPHRSPLTHALSGSTAREGLWFPRIEAIQKEDTFVVRAELPGMNRDDVEVDLTDDALTIRGERREEHHEEREGYRHTEREYGRFHRTIPLPEGVIGESATATFRGGLLEISMKAAPAEANRGRKLEIKEAGEQKK